MDLKKLRNEITAFETSHHISNGVSQRLEKEVKVALGESQEYLDATKEVSLAGKRAQAFQEVANYVKTLQDGGIVSGVRVFHQLYTLHLVQPGLTIEENRTNFNKIFDNLTGDKEEIELFKKVGGELFDLAYPYIADLERSRFIEQTIWFNTLEKFKQAGQIKPIKRVK